jgi:flagellar biosynthetic protein FliR
MDQLLGEIIDKFEIFILILVRMAGLFLMSPVFGRQNVPAYSKVGLSLLLSYMVYSNRYLSTGIE